MELDRWVREGILRKLLGRRRPPPRDCIGDWARLGEGFRGRAIDDSIPATAFLALAQTPV